VRFSEPSSEEVRLLREQVGAFVRSCEELIHAARR